MTVRFVIVSILILLIIPRIFSDIFVYENNRLIEDYDDQPAGFGPSYPNGGIKGYVVLTNPKNGCSKIDPPPNIPISNYKWIALIPRTKNDNSCDFDLKVKNAQDANFSAVIIYNYDDTLITMGSHGRNVNISSTLITHTDGLAIISNYVYNQTSKNLTPTFLFKLTTEQIFKFGAYIIPFVCVIGVSLLGLICFMVVKCYIHRRRTRRHRLPRSALKQLKIKKFVKGDRWEVCAICLDDFEDGAKLRILPCDHAYHMKCIDPWLLNNRRQCPVCKRYVFPNQENSDEEENSGHAATERTPLIQPNDEDSVTTVSGRRFMTIVGAGVANFNYPINELSETEGDDTHDESSPPRASSSHITTTDLVFDQPQSNSRRYPPTQLPRVVLHRSSADENDGGDDDNNNNASTATVFESVQDSISTSFTTPRAANFFVGSVSGTTDNTNVSARSITEDPSDSETDNDERMHSVLTDVEINPAYIPDDESTDILHTNV